MRKSNAGGRGGEKREERGGEKLPPLFRQKNLAFRDNALAYIVVLNPPMMMML